MENISYGKIVLIGAGHVGSAILDSLLRMNLADEIVVITDDGIKEQGTHQQLLDKGGIYAELYAYQFAGTSPQ